MKAHIPNSAFLGNINTFTTGMNLTKPAILEITANPNWISIHPLVLAIVGALGRTVTPANISCQEITAASGHYLVRMGLFSFLGIEPKVKTGEVHHEPTGILIPLSQIKNEKEQNKFIQDLVPLLHMQDAPKDVEAIQHIFSELIRNVIEHSKSPHGAVVCAQYFKKTNRISIAVADTGIGLRQSLKTSYAVKDDLLAIQLALTPGITGTTLRPGGSRQNAGFGLFLTKSIARVNGDYFVIISGEKMYKLLLNGKALKLKRDPFEDRHSLADIPNWKGVAIGVDISLTSSKDFSILLTAIRDFYGKDVRGQKRAYFKKPKFI